MRRLASIRAVLVLLLLTGTLVVASALPALAQATGTVRIGPEATLVAKGAATQVPARYSCTPETSFADLTVQVTQRVGGNRLAEGVGSTTNLICDNQVHTAVVTVTATGENAFRRGVAFARASLFTCDPDGNCTSAPDSREITIVGK
jgi:hypothetical protein